jgi:hypothetical protein
MENLKKKFISGLLLLSVMLNVVLPLGLSFENASAFAGAVPHVFSVVISTCSPIDAIEGIVSKIVNEKNASAAAPVKSNEKQEKAAVSGNALFLPQTGSMSEYSKNIKESSAGFFTAGAGNNYHNYGAAGDFSKQGRVAPVLIFMLLLAYISIIYRDVWVNKTKINIF